MRARLWCLRHARCPPMVPAATICVLRINRLQMEYRRRAEPVRPRHRARACRPPAPPARRGADHNNDGDPASPARGRPATQGRTGDPVFARAGNGCAARSTRRPHRGRRHGSVGVSKRKKRKGGRVWQEKTPGAWEARRAVRPVPTKPKWTRGSGHRRGGG